MKKIIVCASISLFVFFQVIPIGCTATNERGKFSLEGLEGVYLSEGAEELLRENGFVVTPGYRDEMNDVYSECKERNQPIFATTDAVLHTSHIFFDYLLRILEIENLYGTAVKLTDRMLDLSIKQYNEAKDTNVKEAARLNIGFFAIAKKQFNPEYEVNFNLEDRVRKEISNIKTHRGLKFRELLTYVKNPNLMSTPYAYEDYSQYVPRGHYTRNEKFKKYFKALMWYGRIDFKLKPGKEEPAITHGRKMTLQALLMTDVLLKDEEAYSLWKKLYEPTVYFVGKTDDLCVDDYIKLIKEVFPSEGTVDKYNDKTKLTDFIQKAMQLRPSKILSGAAFVEEGEFSISNKGFRFIGQRFIPDSYMFQQLVYGVKELKYKGKGKPFTMEFIPNVGPARAFPRGLDIMAVLKSKKALDILEKEGDTEYEYYYEQLNKLREEFASKNEEEWKQNLYWHWLYNLLPLLEEKRSKNLPGFMQNFAWMDKELQTTLGSWTELRHDTILYAKQSYPMAATAMPPQEPEFTYGYVEPYPEVYERIEEMMRDLKNNLKILGITPQGISEKISSFENLLAKFKGISERELMQKQLTDEDYKLIWNIGANLASMKKFPSEIMKKITSGTDEKIDLVADVHTDPNTKQVLEEGVGSPFNIYVIVEDSRGRRLCRGAVFSYYEFKHPMEDRLTDEKWQEMQKRKERPLQPDWVASFVGE
ncbi:MAG: DUF3160 domain-containing protein [Candidatus Aerophobetes bacterium]|nr:DUF3160 domain-containing protein [Candidatus Aerophobetes bacterium]